MATELQLLVDKVKSYTWYPPDIRPLCGDSTESLFFPAGPGMYDREEGRLSNKKVMVVCDQYSPQLNVLKLHGVRQDTVRTTHGWSELLKTLIQGGIDPLECFFTNYLLGVRESKVPRSIMPDVTARRSPRREGLNPGDPIPLSYFRNHCRDIFQFTIELQRPRLILVLGLRAASLLSRLHPKLAIWQNLKTYRNVDNYYQSIVRDLPLASNQLTTLVLLVHPVGKKTHISTRKNGKSTGEAAEIKLLRTVVANCKL